MKGFETKATINAKKRSAGILPRRKTEHFPLDELLQPFLDVGRIRRATEIHDSLVTIHEVSPSEIRAQVKDYLVRIDVKNETILHDCQEWRNNMDSGRTCKHLAKLLMTSDATRARELLEDIARNEDQWRFTAPDPALALS